ncbi:MULTISPECIES: hypothetical protein [Bacillus]|uniref:hypothetical protein n=1 Tax=Bacillus TaxID=1386 RepID=UPI0013E9F52B|nr:MULTISPECIES: hypothetical protein [Bacillus]
MKWNEYKKTLKFASEDELEKFEKAAKEIENDKEFKELLNDLDTEYGEMLKNLDD